MLEDASCNALVLDDSKQPHRPLAPWAGQHLHRVRALHEHSPVEPSLAARVIGAYNVVSLRMNTKVYFCDPQSPWQRGTNENTNRLLRQYFPKGTERSCFSQADLNAVARRLNGRPRKTLAFSSPADSFQRALR